MAWASGCAIADACGADHLCIGSADGRWRRVQRPLASPSTAAASLLLSAALLLIEAPFGASGADSSVAPAAPSEVPAQQHAVDDLDPGTIGPFLKANPSTAIMFYAPWCFYSQQMLPQWDLAAQKLLLHDPPIHLAKVDAHKHGDIGEKYEVNGFPTIKLLTDGAAFEYSGSGRGWQQIVNWVNQHLDRDHVLKKGEDVEQYLHDNDLNVVGLFEEGYTSSTFADTSRHFEDVMFAEARGSEVAKDVAKRLSDHASMVCETIQVGTSTANSKQVTLPREKMNCSSTPRNPQRPEWTDRFDASVTGSLVVVKRTDSSDGWQQYLQIKCCNIDTPLDKRVIVPVPSVVMFMPHDERFAIYSGNFEDKDALVSWIATRRQPMVQKFTGETAQRIFDDSGPDKTPVVFYISRDTVPDREAIVRDAAKQLRGRASFVISGTSQQVERRLASVAGMEEDQAEPVLTLIETHSHSGPNHVAAKYRLPTGTLTVEAIVQFVTDYEAKKLTPFLKSEPEPTAEEQAESMVTVLVGTTFRKAVDDEAHDVLVDFYAPWCGHCRKFEPTYKDLARRLRHVSSLKVFKIDATRNEIQGLAISGFPTILLFPAGKTPKSPVPYHGDRTPEDMVSFLQQHCSNPFDPKPPPKPAVAVEDAVGSGLLDPSEEDL